MSLLWIMLCRLVITFLPRSKRLSISWLQSPSAVILGPMKIKSISLSKEYLRLISFRMDCFDLLVVQGMLNSLFQHHNLKVSVLQCSAFFTVQHSHPYMTTGKTILCQALDINRILELAPDSIPWLFNKHYSRYFCEETWQGPGPIR